MTRDFLIAGGAWRVQVLNSGPYLIRITNPRTKQALAHLLMETSDNTAPTAEIVLAWLQEAAKQYQHLGQCDLAALQRDNPDAYRDWIAPLLREPSTKGEA